MKQNCFLTVGARLSTQLERMKAIEQSLYECPTCGRVTIHSRNVEKMNWLLHLVLALVTFGVWLIVALLMALSCGPTSAWVCGQCGQTRASISRFWEQVITTHWMTWVMLVVIIFGMLWTLALQK